MKKILIFLMALNLVSYANIKSNFNYEIDFNKRLDYEKENDDEDNYKYIFKANDYKTTRQLAKINGEFKGDSGLFFKYYLESPIKVKNFKKENRVNKKYKLISRDSYNPNLNSKPHLDLALGFDKSFKINDETSIKNLSEIKYIVSSFKGLETLEENELDLSQSFGVLNKNINFNLNGSYSSINLFNPIEYKLGLSLDKDIKNQNLKLKLAVNHKLDELIIKNRIQENISTLSLKEYETVNYSFYVEDYAQKHQRRILGLPFDGVLNSYLYVIPELTLEYKNKLNDNLKLSLSNTTKYDVFRYSGTLKGYKKKLFRNASVGQTETKDYKASFDEIKNLTNFSLDYDNKKIKNTSNVGLEYVQSFYSNDYNKGSENKGEYIFHFYNVLDMYKRNFRTLKLNLENKSSYKIDLNSKLSLKPNLDLKYVLNGEQIIMTKEDQDGLVNLIKEKFEKLEKAIQVLEEKERAEVQHTPSLGTSSSAHDTDFSRYRAMGKDLIEKEVETMKIYINSAMKKLNRRNFVLSHKLTVNPGVAMNYSFENGINFYTKVSVPFTFKTRVMEDPKGKVVNITNRQGAVKKIATKFAPSHFDVKVTTGIKFNF